MEGQTCERSGVSPRLWGVVRKGMYSGSSRVDRDRGEHSEGDVPQGGVG